MNNLNRLLLTTLLACAGALHAAEPELKTGIVKESYVYPRQKATVTIAGIPTTDSTVDVSHVTVVLGDRAITAEWEPKTSLSADAGDFKPGTEVMAAVQGSRLILRAPDDSTVSAKIVSRKKAPSQ
jgi:hypothetical protein